jgi:hypothetical protein
MEGVAKLRVRRFLGLFWPIFPFFDGVNIRKPILTPSKKGKIGSKEPENRQNLSFAIPSMDCQLEIDQTQCCGNSQSRTHEVARRGSVQFSEKPWI